MRIWTQLSVSALLTLSAPAFGAAVLLPVDATNLTPAEVSAIGKIVAAAYQNERKETVLPMTLVEQALAETGNERLAAQKLGATEYVRLEAVRLSQRIVLHGSAHSPDGELLHAAKISAMSLDDIEPASERLARALVTRRSTTETQTLDSITNAETGTPNRMATERLEGFKGGVTYPIGWGERVAPMMSAAFDLRMEGRQHFIELGIGIAVPAGDYDYAYGGIWGDVGASLYLSETSVSPYVGLGLMPRLISESPANIAVYTQAGAMFFRESRTRIYADFRVAQNLLPVDVATGEPFGEASGSSTANDEEKLYPTELTLNVGIGF